MVRARFNELRTCANSGKLVEAPHFEGILYKKKQYILVIGT